MPAWMPDDEGGLVDHGELAAQCVDLELECRLGTCKARDGVGQGRTQIFREVGDGKLGTRKLGACFTYPLSYEGFSNMST